MVVQFCGRRYLRFFNYIKCFQATNSLSNNSLYVTCSFQEVSLGLPLFVNSSRTFTSSSISMKGHSEWQNRKRFKEAHDKQRAEIIMYQCQQLRRAVIEGGSSDPKLNSKLAAAIQYAMNNDVPKSTIESAIKKTDNVKMKTMFLELVGPGDCLLLVELEARHPTIAIHEMKVICRRHGRSRIILDRTCYNAFERKGVVVVTETNLDGVKMDEEAATEEAIESSAEEVTSQDNNGNKAFQFLSSFEDFHKMKLYLEKKRHKIIYSELCYIPKIETELNENDLQSFKNLFEKIKVMPEANVLHIYDNVQIPEK